MTRELTLPDTCDWCGESIDAVDDAVMVIDGRPHRDSHVRAAFHDDERPCYSESRDYGWS